MKTIVTELQTSRDGLIPHLGDQFTSHTTFLSELLQNARRSGSPDVRVFYDPNNAVLTVEDSGSGISSPEVLFNLGESGFRSHPTVSSEQPFGMGFAACLFAADEVFIDSLTFSCSFDTAAALRFEPIEATLSEDGESFFDGTRVSLALKQETVQALERAEVGTRFSSGALKGKMMRMVAGFPIPVFLNGEELPRPHALSDDFEGSSVKVRLLDWGSVGSLSRVPYTTFYLHGMPVKVDDARSRRTEAVAHLDNSFRARVPDRDVLIECDKDRAYSAAREVLLGQIRAHLANLKSVLGPEEFADTYWGAASCFSPELLADSPLPGRFCFKPVGPLRYPEYDGDALSDFRENVSGFFQRNERLVKMGDDIDAMEASAAHYLLAKAHNLVCVEPRLIPKGHWAESLPDFGAIGVSAEPVEFSGSTTLTGRHADNLEVVFCASVRIRNADGLSADVDDAPVADPRYPPRLFWPAKASASWARNALLQVFSYTPEWGDLEAELDHDEALLRNAVVAANSLESAVEEALSNDLRSLSGLLRGKSFRVSIDDKGCFSVVADAA